MSIYFWMSIDCFLHAEECRYSICWQWVSAHANQIKTPKFNPQTFANLPNHDLLNLIHKPLTTKTHHTTHAFNITGFSSCPTSSYKLITLCLTLG